MDFTYLRRLVVLVALLELLLQDVLQAVISEVKVIHAVVLKELCDEVQVVFLVLDFGLGELDVSVDALDQTASRLRLMRQNLALDEFGHFVEDVAFNLDELDLRALLPSDVLADLLVQLLDEFEYGELRIPIRDHHVRRAQH